MIYFATLCPLRPYHFGRVSLQTVLQKAGSRFAAPEGSRAESSHTDSSKVSQSTLVALHKSTC